MPQEEGQNELQRDAATSIATVVGENHISIIHSTPFSIVSCTIEDGGVKCSPVVEGQLPRTAVARPTSFILPLLEMQKGKAAQLDLAGETHFMATIWALQSDTSYTVVLKMTTEQPMVASGDAAAAPTVEVPATTAASTFPLCVTHPVVNFLSPSSMISRPDIIECLCSQGKEESLHSTAPSPVRHASLRRLLRQLWWNALFALPEIMPVRPNEALWYLCLLNPLKRYVLDLQAAPQPLPPPGREGDTAAGDGEDRQDGDHGGDRGAVAVDPTTSKSLIYPWRQNARVRRIIDASAFSVVVRECPEAIAASLWRAALYHSDRGRGIWLHPEYIEALARTAEPPFAGDEANARLCCIELVDRYSGEVVAGCCGMTVGALYHDFSMYTLRRTKDRLGTFLTKLIGEALQQCGYHLWYWGFKIEYMADFQSRYGGTDMSREDFYQRWIKGRAMQPRCPIGQYLREDRGMVPFYAPLKTQ